MKSFEMKGLEEGDVLIRNYDTSIRGAFVECWEFETKEGEYYTIFQDQDGEEWVE